MRSGAAAVARSAPADATAASPGYDGVRSMLPVPVDLASVLGRLAAEESSLRARLAALEARLRALEDVERPAYARWLRLTFGPALATLDARRDELHARRTTAWRVQELVERDGWSAREALFLVLHPEEIPVRRDRMDEDEVEARRRAKLERKRAERKAAKRARSEERAARRAGGRGSARSEDDGRLENDAHSADRGDVGSATRAAQSRTRLVVVYRAVARRLHPDSPDVLRGHDPLRVKTLWHDAQAAYAGRDADRLLAIAAWLDAVGDGAPPVLPSSPAERSTRIRGLARAVRTLERRLAEEMTDPAWEFSRRSARERERLRADAARRLDAEAQRMDALIADVDAALDAIGSPRRPRVR